jgi:transposase
MSTKFISVDRNQRLLLPPDLRDWILPDNVVHFIIASVEELPMTDFKVNQRGTGSAQYHPHMMLALLIYCYANGRFASRRIEQATYDNISVRYLTADTHPDHDSIATFRRENFDAVRKCFVRVLELAEELGLLKVGRVSVDGTTLKAHANKKRNVRYDRATELEKQLSVEVGALLEKAERADAEDAPDGQSLPKELARHENLRAKIVAGMRNMEKRARAKAEAERPEYERKVRERNDRKGSRKGCEIHPPVSTPRPNDMDNLTDTDSRLMRHNIHSAYEQAYNGQATVDADGSMLVLSAHVSQCASDGNELVKNIEGIPASLGRPHTALADTGYLNEREVRALEGNGEKPKMNVLVSCHAEEKLSRRKHDFRPAPKEEPAAPQTRSAFVLEMKKKMESPENKAHYKKRKESVEPAFGTIKEWIGFRQFHLRGLEKVAGEWKLVTLAYNFRRLWKIIGNSYLQACPA